MLTIITARLAATAPVAIRMIVLVKPIAEDLEIRDAMKREKYDIGCKSNRDSGDES
jgi:hypothetical protein